MNFKKMGKVLTSKFVGTGPSSYEKKCRAAVSQRVRNTGLNFSYQFIGRCQATLTYLNRSKRIVMFQVVEILQFSMFCRGGGVSRVHVLLVYFLL